MTNNRLAPVPEEQTEELLKAIEFPIGNICEITSLDLIIISNRLSSTLGSMDTSNMQDMMTANSSAPQQSVIQGTSPMNQHGPSNQNSLLYTATIYAQDMSAMSQNNNQQQQQMMSMHQNRQQSNESSQAMMSDLNPFISGSIGMNQQQQQTQQSSEQMMSAQAEADSKDFKGKFSRGCLRNQLP